MKAEGKGKCHHLHDNRTWLLKQSIVGIVGIEVKQSKCAVFKSYGFKKYTAGRNLPFLDMYCNGMCWLLVGFSNKVCFIFKLLAIC